MKIEYYKDFIRIMMPSDFIQYLVENNFLSKEKFENLLRESEERKERIEDLILKEGIIPEKEFFQRKSEFFKIPLVQNANKKISTSVLKEISREAANYYKIVPLKRYNNILEIGMLNPEDFSSQAVINFIARKKNLKIEIYLILPSDFKEVMKKYHLLREEIKEAIEELETEKIAVKEAVLETRERVIKEAPISKIIDINLSYAIEGRASDIHIEPFGDRLRMRFRVDGILYSSFFLEKRYLPALVSRIKILSNLRIDESRIPQDGRFRATVLGKVIDFRVGTFPTAQGEKVAIRVLDPEKRITEIKDLGVSPFHLKIIDKALELPFGSLIFCGPTGCGKTTTQYAFLQKLNDERVNILSLEDPVEYLIDGVNQSQIRPEIKYTFASGLRQMVRQDPDIIMVGEVRDKETAELVTHASLTGHLVFFTLHTNNAIGAIPRLIDLGVERFLIPIAVKMIISQRLVRKLCPKCKQKIKANKKEKIIIEKVIAQLPENIKPELKNTIFVYRPKGCSFCNFKGAIGRIGIFEILKLTKELEEIILTDSSESRIEEEARRQEMITLKQDGVLKALEGLLSLEEVLKITEMKETI